MPNSHLQKTDTPIYPIHTRIFEDFLGVHDFTPFIDTTFTEFKKGDRLKVEVPHLKKLSKGKITELLIDANIPISEFEDYYRHLQSMDNFNDLVKLSSNTLKK